MTASNQRKNWMGLMAKSAEGRLPTLFDSAFSRPEFTWLRAPEIGTAMVRGRAGASGAAFNLGEVTVTRCSLRLSCGTVGHAYIQGRRKADAETAALVDALMQTEQAPEIEQNLLSVLAAERESARQSRARKAAATKVDFFTMVRGEDA